MWNYLLIILVFTVALVLFGLLRADTEPEGSSSAKSCDSCRESAACNHSDSRRTASRLSRLFTSDD